MSKFENAHEQALTVATEPKNTIVSALENLNNTTFCSFIPATPDEKTLLFRAMNNPDHKVADVINMEILVRDVFVEEVDIVNDDTGELIKCPRIVLIDTKGKSYNSVSWGIFNSVRKLIQVFGSPTWKEGIKVKVKQITRGERKILTLEI